MEDCKRCLLLESSREDVFATIQWHLSQIPEDKKATQELYEQRLDICRQCDNLISGICIKCGCYVEFRAAFSTQKCPDVKLKNW